MSRTPRRMGAKPLAERMWVRRWARISPRVRMPMMARGLPLGNEGDAATLSASEAMTRWMSSASYWVRIGALGYGKGRGNSKCAGSRLRGWARGGAAVFELLFQQ